MGVLEEFLLWKKVSQFFLFHSTHKIMGVNRCVVEGTYMEPT